MSTRAEAGRIALAVATAVGLVLSLLLVTGGLPARANHVEPELITGNEDCAAATGLQELTKFEPVANGTQAGVSIIVNGDVFDWTSTVPIAAVFVKGGPNGNLYDYRPGGSMGDTGLHAPVNPNNNQFFGLSHVTFCVPDPSTTTTTVPEETTTTVADETTTTVADETTTTVADETTTTVPDETTTTVPEETTTTIEDEVGGIVVTPEDEEETTTTVEDEVLGTEVLPFTGGENERLALLALALLASGGLAFVAARRVTE